MSFQHLFQHLEAERGLERVFTLTTVGAFVFIFNIFLDGVISNTTKTSVDHQQFSLTSINDKDCDKIYEMVLATGNPPPLTQSVKEADLFDDAQAYCDTWLLRSRQISLKDKGTSLRRASRSSRGNTDIYPNSKKLVFTILRPKVLSWELFMHNHHHN
ncbi:hypothetical protein ACMFMG_002622 [Clarireedia jacksonii]